MTKAYGPTIDFHRLMRQKLPPEDGAGFVKAQKEFVGIPERGEVLRARFHGLFEVTDRVYQVRGFDIAGITFVEGDTGLSALDALSCADTAAAASVSYRQHRDPESQRPLHTVMFSHSRADHFGGVHRTPLVPEPAMDASVISTLIGGNTNASTILITE